MAAAAAAATTSAVAPSTFRSILHADSPNLSFSFIPIRLTQPLRLVLALSAPPRRFLPEASRRFCGASAAYSGADSFEEEEEDNDDEWGADADDEEGGEEFPPQPTRLRGYGGPRETRRLFVGNLPFKMTADKLAEIFCEAGAVDDVEVIYDRITNKSRGFAFVTMASADDANETIRMFDGAQVGGRILKVNFPEVPRGGERELAASMGGKVLPSSPYTVYCGNLGWFVTSQMLNNAFAAQSGLLGAKVIYNNETGRSRGFGYVTFRSAEDMQNAIEAMNGVEIEGRPVRLKVAERRQRTGPSSRPARMEMEPQFNAEQQPTEEAEEMQETNSEASVNF